MTAPTIADLTARVEVVRRASLIAKPAAAEVALVDLLQYLAAQDSRIEKIERVVRYDDSEKTSGEKTSGEKTNSN